MIFSIFEESDHRRVKKLLPQQRAYESVHKKVHQPLANFVGHWMTAVQDCWGTMPS